MTDPEPEPAPPPPLADEVVGAVLLEYRTKAGLSAQQVAERIGITSSGVYYWEHGKRTPRAFDLPVIAKALGVKSQTLYARIDQALREAGIAETYQPRGGPPPKDAGRKSGRKPSKKADEKI